MKDGREDMGVDDEDVVSSDPSTVLVGKSTSSAISVGSTRLLASSSASEDSREIVLDKVTASPKSWASVRSARSRLRSE